MNSIAIICLFIIIIVLRECASIPPPAPVIVNKCCRIGESLDENHQCNIGGDSNWWPIIFMMLKKSYFQPYGSAPRFFKIRERTHPYCQHQDYPIGMHSMALFSNGSLYLSEKHKFIEPHNFCVDKETAIICDPDNNTPDALMLHQKPIKIRKCCGKNAVYRTIENTCVPSNSFPTMEKLVYSSSSVDFVFAFPDCKISKYFTIAEKFNESNLDMGTGRLVLETGRKVDTKNFCLEHVFMNNIFNETSSVHVFTCADHLSIQSNQTADTSMDIRFILFPVGLLISVVFLSTTLAIRYILPPNHHILHWRCQTFYVTCLLIGDLLLAFTQLFGHNVKGFACVTIAVCMHFFFLSAFFWLNTMCFNIWWTFRDFRPTSLERSQEKVRLRIYKVYALGIPFLISAFAATFDHMRKNSLTDYTYLQPRFCEKEYWFGGNLEKLAYFYGPIGILLCINLLLFASTTRQLTCGLWKREEVKSTTERTTLGRVCIKLVIVMGVTWIADIISWAHSVWSGGSHYIWIVTDLINALQGVLIFIVIGCQPQVSNAVKQIWRSKNIQFRNRSNDTNQRNSSSSQVASSLGESMTNNTFTTSNAKISAETAC